METIAEEEAREEAIAWSVLRSRPVPEDVHGMEITFDEDEYGDPIMWVWLDIDDVPHPPQDRIERFVKFIESSRDALLAKNLKHYPMFRLRGAKPAR